MRFLHFHFIPPIWHLLRKLFGTRAMLDTGKEEASAPSPCSLVHGQPNAALSILSAKAKREMGWIRLVFIFFTERKHIHLSGKTDFFHATRNCVLWILTWRILGNVRYFLTASFLLWFYKRLKKYILLASSFL